LRLQQALYFNIFVASRRSRTDFVRFVLRGQNHIGPPFCFLQRRGGDIRKRRSGPHVDDIRSKISIETVPIAVSIYSNPLWIHSTYRAMRRCYRSGSLAILAKSPGIVRIMGPSTFNTRVPQLVHPHIQPHFTVYRSACFGRGSNTTGSTGAPKRSRAAGDGGDNIGIPDNRSVIYDRCVSVAASTRKQSSWLIQQ
jgi:hypothetical protein